VKAILGNACIVDRLDSRSVDSDPESSEFLTCWVWMEDPNDLPRSVGYSIFAAGAGKAFDINGLASPLRIPSTPPKGKDAERVILVHLARYEDWSPKTPGGATASGTSSETGSSAPTIVPFDWSPGVIDGRPARGRRPMIQNCRAPPAPQQRQIQNKNLPMTNFSCQFV
jgi:hypothetical protein